MCETFNIKRFGRLAVKRYAENGKRYLFCAALAAISLTLLMLAATTEGATFEIVPIIFFFPVFMGATVLMVQSEMKPLRDRHSCQITGTLPSSRFEQYFLTLLNTTIGMAVIFVVIYFAIGGIFSLCSEKIVFSQLWQEYSFNRLYWFFTGFFANSMAMYAATTRMKSQIWALVVVWMAFSFFLALPAFLPQLLHDWGLTGTVTFDPMFSGFNGWTTVGDTTIGYSYNMVKVTTSEKPGLWLISFWTVMIWTAAYFKFKNRQLK